MLVIAHGTNQIPITGWEATCSICKCIFKFDKHDIISNLGEDAKGKFVRVFCPECHRCVFRYIDSTAFDNLQKGYPIIYLPEPK